MFAPFLFASYTMIYNFMNILQLLFDELVFKKL